MKISFCNLNKNYKEIKNEIDSNVLNVLDSCKYIQGYEVTNFENNFSKFIGMKHCIGVANGTDALEIAISSLDIPNDSEIIVQGNTYIATCFGVIHNNYKLVLCDVDKDTHMIDLNDLRKKITRKTRVLILVHLYGFMPNMNDILELCEENNIFLIEDCAQSHGAIYSNRRAGSFGKLSCFSFYPSKNLGAYGDGGCIMTNDDELSTFIRKKANMGSLLKYNHEIIGRNSRLDTLQASILNIKLKYLDDNNKKRLNIANLYNSYLKSNPNIILPIVLDNTIPVYHLYVIRAKHRDLLLKYLSDNGIETLIHYPIPLCESDALIPYINNHNQMTNNVIGLCSEIISLPMYPELEEDEVKYVCEKINDFYQYYDYKNTLQIQTCVDVNVDKLTTLSIPIKIGNLHCLNRIDFNTKRLFYVDGFENESLPITRGNHAIINFNELLVMISGKIKLTLIHKDKEGFFFDKKEIILSKNDVYLIESNTWIVYEIQDNNTRLLVLCDKEHYESIKEYNYDTFITLSSESALSSVSGSTIPNKFLTSSHVYNSRSQI